MEALERSNLTTTKAVAFVLDLGCDPSGNIPWNTSDSVIDKSLVGEGKYKQVADLEALISAEIDTFSYTLGIIAPSDESLEGFQLQQRAFDNRMYQRQNHEACESLQIANPNAPKLRSMNRSAALKSWQPVAIAAILQMREGSFLKGAILGDRVGLGKTWEALGYYLL